MDTHHSREGPISLGISAGPWTHTRRWPVYRHDTEGPDDMAAHARNMLTDTALTVPVSAGRLLLGTWQGIYLWEHRTSPQQRRIVVTILGA